MAHVQYRRGRHVRCGLHRGAWRAGRPDLTGHAWLSGHCSSALGFVATKNLWVAVFFSALLGFSLNVMSTSIQALMQLAADDRMRGRVMALYLLLFRGFPALGALALGFLADVIGLRVSLAMSAALSLIFLAMMVPRRKAVAAQLETGARSAAAEKPES